MWKLRDWRGDVVDDSPVLRQVDLESVGPPRDEYAEWLDCFDIFEDPFTGKEVLMVGRDYNLLCERFYSTVRRGVEKCHRCGVSLRKENTRGMCLGCQVAIAGGPGGESLLAPLEPERPGR